LPDGLKVGEDATVVSEDGEITPRRPEGIVARALDYGRAGELGEGQDLQALRVDGGQAPVSGPAVHLEISYVADPNFFYRLWFRSKLLCKVLGSGINHLRYCSDFFCQMIKFAVVTYKVL
jgi:hypothetical protein